MSSLSRKANRLRREARRAASVGARELADKLLREAVAAENVLVGQAAARAGKEADKVLTKQRKDWSAELDRKLLYIGVGTGVTLFGLYIVTRRTA
jgi:hypothetical protein